MKTGLKKVASVILVVACAGLITACAGTYGTWDEQWYSSHPMTQDELVARLGTPDRVIAHDDGMQELIYVRKIPPSGTKSAFAYQVKNGEVIKQYWKEL